MLRLFALVIFGSVTMVTGVDRYQCSGVDENLTIDCGDNGIITVKLGRVHYTDDSPSPCELPNSHILSCTETVTSQITNGCNDRRRCTVNSGSLPSRPFLYCYKSRVLHVRFTCTILSGFLNSVDGNHTGRTVDIKSPHFPCRIPAGYKSINCTVTPASSSVNGVVRVSIRRLYFPAFSAESQEKLQYSAGGEVLELHSQHSEDLTRRDHLFVNAVGPVDLLYDKEGADMGGSFWIRIEGGNSEVEVSCQSERNHVTEPTESSETCKPYWIPLTTTSPPLTTVKSPNSSGPHDSSSNRSAFIWVGVAIAVIVAIAILIILILLIRRKRKLKRSPVNQSQDSSIGIYAEQENIYQNQGKGMTDNMETIELEETVKCEYNDLYETSNEIKEDGQNNIEKSREDATEETIMVENEELYDAGYQDMDSDPIIGAYAEVNKLKTKKDKNDAKNHITTNEPMDNEMDETVRCEINDLYESNDALQDINTVSEENDNKDETIMCETNELYETSNEPKEDGENGAMIEYVENDVYCSSTDLAENPETELYKNNNNFTRNPDHVMNAPCHVTEHSPGDRQSFV